MLYIIHRYLYWYGSAGTPGTGRFNQIVGFLDLSLRIIMPLILLKQLSRGK
jgi:hypothetical protein